MQINADSSPLWENSLQAGLLAWGNGMPAQLYLHLQMALESACKLAEDRANVLHSRRQAQSIKASQRCGMHIAQGIL